MSWSRFQKRSDHWKVIGSLISRQLTISRSDRIPWTILLRSNHDPGDPVRYADRCWIRNFITTIDHFISNITIVKIYKLPGNIYWNMVCLVSTVCIFSMTLITYTYLSKYGMSKPYCIVSKHCVRALNRPWCFRIGTHKWRRHTSNCDVMNRYHQSDVFHLIATT